MGNSPNFLTEPPSRPMRIKDLLCHMSGLTYGFMHRTPVDAGYRKAGLEGARSSGNLEETVEKIASLPLEFSPGERWNYSMATDVLGYLVQVVSGKPFEQFLRDEIFDVVLISHDGESLDALELLDTIKITYQSIAQPLGIDWDTHIIYFGLPKLHSRPSIWPKTKKSLYH